MPTFCDVKALGSDFYGLVLGAETQPFIIEVGDADCNTEAFTFPADALVSNGILSVQGGGLGSMCMTCELPGTIDIAGDYATLFCP